MTARTIAVETEEDGLVITTEPAWCRTDHTATVMFRADIVHLSQASEINIRVGADAVELLAFAVAAHPFSDQPDGRRTHLWVILGGDQSWECQPLAVFAFTARLGLALPRVLAAAVRVTTLRMRGTR